MPVVGIAEHTLCKVSTLVYRHPQCRFIGVKSGSRNLIGNDEVWHIHFLLSLPLHNYCGRQEVRDSRPDNN